MFLRISRSTLIVIPLVAFSHFTLANTFSIYGQGHLSIDSVNDGVTTSQYVASNSSRLGFTGNYNIDDSLTVIFQYESGVDLTAQGGNDGNGGAESSGQILTKGRPTYIGLSGNFGKILIGHTNALDQWANDYNLFADQVGDIGNLWEGSGIPGRLDNVIYYETVNYNGMSVAVTYVPDEDKQNSSKLIVKGNYHVSALKMGLAYASIGQNDSIKEDHTALAMTVGYDFGKFTLGGGVQYESDVQGIKNIDRSSYTIGGSIRVSEKGTFKSQFVISNGNGNDDNASQLAIGYDYALNADTSLYLAYAKTNNQAAVNFSSNGKGHGDKVTPQIGNDPSAISLGIVSKFDINIPW